MKRGEERSKIYRAWDNMKQRTRKHKNYIEKNITFCERWDKFENFYEDMSRTYKDGLTLDRIDNDGDYEPNNCRWASYTTQSRNRRVLSKRNTSGFRGVRSATKKNGKTTLWKVLIVVDKKEIYLGTFKDAKVAGLAYDKYVKDNNLDHPTNGLL